MVPAAADMATHSSATRRWCWRTCWTRRYRSRGHGAITAWRSIRSRLPSTRQRQRGCGPHERDSSCIMLDLRIKGGKVIDGTGAAARVADVGVKDGRIVAIGDFAGEATENIDATGLIVAPGFIDIHSHSDYTLLVDPRAVSALKQGVTLEVIGNCGFGCGPIRDPKLAAGNIYGFNGAVPLVWTRLGDYLDRLAAVHPAVNVLTLVP